MVLVYPVVWLTHLFIFEKTIISLVERFYEIYNIFLTSVFPVTFFVGPFFFHFSDAYEKFCLNLESFV